MNARLGEVTERIARRSYDTRQRYLERIAAAAERGPSRAKLGCANQAHGFAACGVDDKTMLREGAGANLAIVTAYNDMLSAHQPYENYPELIRTAARRMGGVAQVAGGVPAMCDGVTQGEAGMELSLFSRDVIALATAVALSHQTFDAAVFLGICDKIVPGLVIGALSFGHLPAVFIPAGPMTSGLSNDDKAKIRQLFAEGKVGRDALLEAESQAYHGPGTCTFYGTANTNQMMMEIMGLHLPGASFVNPNTPLREALTTAAAERAMAITALGNDYVPVGRMLDEKVFVNGVVGLHATGGSTNHTLHVVAMAAAAGIKLSWDDFSELADITPLLCRVYPNGKADVNHFHAAGGMGFVIRELLGAGLLHRDVETVWGGGLDAYTREPMLAEDGSLAWRDGTATSGDENVVRGASRSVPADRRAQAAVRRPRPGGDQDLRHRARAPRHRGAGPRVPQPGGASGRLQGRRPQGRFRRRGALPGPKANGMPELHKLMPPLGVLQDRGNKVALVTDGRLSGASGKVPAAIHVTPEAADGGAIALIRNGDLVRVDAVAGTLTVLVDPEVWAERAPAPANLAPSHVGVGRELFASFRAAVGTADTGATIFAV